ncbi:MAG TPA: peptidyl-prolyl cis-trans isomerase, partial [Vicinamibacteria bacterium]|nr:peptidyl-prolyl cis-trans isomerase [Vicinamibacteria bacterium]
DDEVRKYYESHKPELTASEKRRVAHIVVPSEEEAQEIRKKLDAGDSWVALVTAYSSDTPSVRQGGDLGWITKKDASGEFAKVFDLQEGEFSEPLKSKFGWHLVRVEKIVPERAQTLDEAREGIQKRILEQKQRDARLVWVKQLRAAALIRYSDRNIRAFVRQSQRDAEAKPMPAGHGPSGAGAPPGH